MNIFRGASHRSTFRRLVAGSAVGASLAATVLATGAMYSSTAGASGMDLGQRIVASAGPVPDLGPSVAKIPRTPGLPNISKVTTASGAATDVTAQVATTGAGISATYVGTTLIVNWDSGNSLTVAGAGPLAAGSTVVSLFGFGPSGSITVGGGRGCSAPLGIGEVDIDQMVAGPSGTVTALALTFGCITSTLDYAITGTVGLNVPPSTRLPGYNLFEGNGAVSSAATLGTGGLFGVDVFGDMSGSQLNQPIVGMATTSLDGGYWLVARDGGVFSFGDAAFYGSTGNLRLNMPVLGMAATPDGKGYWFVASDGGVFSYGDADFFGSTGGMHLNQPIVGMAATPDGRGYWLVARDGGIFSYGDARFYGSTGAMHLNQPIVGMAASPDGNGYWLVAADGGIFSFGDAGFHGSTGGTSLNSPIVGMASSEDGAGYWLTASDGGVFSFGDAQFFGGLGGTGVDDVAGITP
jgi:hypothetical protein